MPGRKWYAISLVVFLVGAATAGVLIYMRLSGLARELPQVLVPGEAELTFNRPGTYTIFFEHESMMNGRVFSTGGQVPGMRVRLASPSGAPIALDAPSTNTSYSIGGRSGVAVLTCEIQEPGRYHLAADYPDGRAEPQGVLAIGLGVAGRIFTTILLALATGLTAAAVAAIIAARTFWKRRKASRHVAFPPEPGAALGSS